MRLKDYLEPELVMTDLAATGAEDTIRTLVDRLHEAGRIEDPEMVRQAVLSRERSHTTSLGNGVALPHACISGIERARVLVAVAPDGVPFGPDREAATDERLFFLLLSPLDQAGTHIKLLARIVRLVRDVEFVDALVSAASPDEVIEAIEREDALHV